MDRQNHLISLVAVFLSLGIGILIGASMGVNALVLNQISVIEELQEEIHYFKSETEIYNEKIKQLNQDISEWELLEEHYFNPVFIKDRLAGYTVKVIRQGDFTRELKDFLDLTGCRYRVFLFAGDVHWDELEDEAGEILSIQQDGLTPLITDILLHENEDNISQMLEFLHLNTFVSVYEKGPVDYQEEKTGRQQIFFVTGTLDPFLYNIVEHLSRKQESVFFISLEKELLQEVSGNPYKANYQVINSLPGKMKLLESIENLVP